MDTSEGGQRLLTAAAACNLVGVLTELAAGVQPSQESPEGLTALMLACSSSNAATSAGTSVVVALLAGDGLALIDRRCTEHGAEDGCSALMLAARCGAGNLVQALIEAGAALELQCILGESAWVKASQGGHSAAMLALEGAGARRPHLPSREAGWECVPLPRIESGLCSAARFAAQFRGRVAVVVTGAASEWPACKAWASRETLEARLGGAAEQIPCLTTSSGRQFAPAERHGGASATASVRSVGEALDATLFGQAADGEARADELAAPLSIPREVFYCKLELSARLAEDCGRLAGLPAARAARGETRFWMSSAGAETPLHFDHCHSVIAQIVGRKRLIIFPPTEHPFLYPYRSCDGNPRTSRVDIERWRGGDASERRRWPRLARSFCYETVLLPGDCAYIPPGHWHAVTSLSASISVLAPFDMLPREQRAMPRPWTEEGWGAERSRSASPSAGSPAGAPPALGETGPTAAAPLGFDDPGGMALGADMAEPAPPPQPSEPIAASAKLRNGRTAVVRESPGSAWEGGSVWPPAPALVALLDAGVHVSAEDLARSSVLELGAGLGLVGIAAALLGARSVVLSDLPVALPTLAANVAANESDGTIAAIQVAALDWRSSEQPLLADGRRFDLVIASECLYHADMVAPLLTTAHRACAPGGTLLLSGIIGGEATSVFRSHAPRFFESVEALPSSDGGEPPPTSRAIHRLTRPRKMGVRPEPAIRPPSEFAGMSNA